MAAREEKDFTPPPEQEQPNTTSEIPPDQPTTQEETKDKDPFFDPKVKPMGTKEQKDNYYHNDFVELDNKPLEYATFDDVYASGDIVSFDITPNVMLPIAEKLRNMCDEEFIKRWEDKDIIRLCSELEMLRSKIDRVLICIGR